MLQIIFNIINQVLAYCSIFSNGLYTRHKKIDYKKILSYFSVFHPQLFDIVVSAVILTLHKSHKC